MSRYASIGRMLIRALHFGVDECAVAVEPPRTSPATGWVWIDVTAGPDDLDELAVLVTIHDQGPLRRRHMNGSRSALIHRSPRPRGALDCS